MSSAGRSATRLELEVDATVATLGAWCYPSDNEVRIAAAQAAGLVGVDYIESIAMLCEGTGCDPHTARQKVAAGFMERVAACVNAGETPRLGVLADGRPLGADEEEYA